MAIIFSKKGEKDRKIEQSGFPNEDELQRYIYHNPDSIPVYEIEEDTKLLILCREFETESGPIDAFGIDRCGRIYLVETKLHRNTDRREVVAQVLDYGASLWAHPTQEDRFYAELAAESKKDFGVEIDKRITDKFGLGNGELEQLKAALFDNLNKGRFRFVVLMDSVDDKLKDLVKFINETSKFDIYCVEFQKYDVDDCSIIIPKIYGAEAKKDLEVAPRKENRRLWDEQSFFADLSKKVDKQACGEIRKLYDFSSKNASRIDWGHGTQNGSFNPKFDIEPRSIYGVYSDGTIQVNYYWLKNAEFISKLKSELETIGIKTIFDKNKDESAEVAEVPTNKIDLFIAIMGKILNIGNN